MTRIKQSNFDFLNLLSKNNNRDWFNENKGLYLKNKEELELFADDLLQELKEHDDIETVSGKKALYRVYRDVRFSKDKTPYKTVWSGSFKRATKYLRGGYYFHLEPGNSFLGGGFWGPSSADLKLIRSSISEFGDELLNIINSKQFVSNFGELGGDKLKTAPKGIAKDHEYIDLLRHKQFLLGKKFTDAQVMSKDFIKELNGGFEAMRPFFDFMSEALTTDSNGESIV